MTTREILEILEAAPALIATAPRFTSGTWARDAAGQPVSATDPAAVAWDGDGAVRKAMGTYEADAHFAVMEALRNAMMQRQQTFRAHSYVGDVQDHATVLAIFDAAIAREAGRGATVRAAVSAAGR